MYSIEETDEEYVGFFHVMPGIGIMTDRHHTESSKALMPIDWGNTTYVPKITL